MSEIYDELEEEEAEIVYSVHELEEEEVEVDLASELEEEEELENGNESGEAESTVIAEPIKVRCKYCTKRFTDVNKLAKHYETRHRIRRPYAFAIATFRKYGVIIQYTEDMKEYDKMVEEQYAHEENESESKGWKEIFEVG